MGTKSFRKVYSGSLENRQLQSNIEDAIGKIIRNPILDGIIFDDLQLVSGSNAIAHKLARVPRGFIVIGQSNASTIYTASKNEKFLNVVTSGAVTVSILVF
jgi:hypothetical protein